MESVLYTVVIRFLLWVIVAGVICSIAKGLSLLGYFSTVEILIGFCLSAYLFADNTKK